jgi:membrane protein DedA with SNARE-associated domain
MVSRMSFVRNHIYYFLFIILIFEWPITSFVGWNYASQWDLSLVLFSIVALAWDVVWDVMLYFLWRYFHKSKLVNRFNILKRTKDYIVEQKFLEKLLSKYAFLYFLVVKITPYISGTWLTVAWIKKYDFWKFLFYSLIISCIVKAVYIWLGYLWGISLAKLKLIHRWWGNFVIFLVLWVILFYLAKIFSKKFIIRLKKKYN